MNIWTNYEEKKPGDKQRVLAVEFGEVVDAYFFKTSCEDDEDGVKHEYDDPHFECLNGEWLTCVSHWMKHPGLPEENE